MPVRAAASLERGLSAPDAPRQGAQVPQGGDAFSGPAAHEYRSAGQARDDSGRRADGEQGQHDAVGPKSNGQDAWRASRAQIAALRGEAVRGAGATSGRLAGEG